jgi:hypothetical protein
MEFLSALWLPIVVGAVLVFVVSSLVHMVFQWHKSDCHGLPDEARTMDVLRPQNLAPGMYVIPYASSMKDCGTPEMMAKYQAGPVGFLTVLPKGVPNIGKSLIQWFVYTLLVGALTGYVAWHTLGTGADVAYLQVFRITGAIAFGIYGLASSIDSIWKGMPWGSSLKYMFDGLLYAFCTAGAFGWLWPEAAAA